MKSRRLCLLSVIAIVVLAGQPAGRAAAGRAMTIDDLLGAIRIGDPQLSADGKTVAFSRTTTDVKSGKRNADIWAVAADGSGSPKELIGGDKSESTPRYSPDGRRLAFISSRDGAPQVYVADADGSNAKKITNLPMGVEPPLVFSPDGNRLAFVSDVYPECTDEACNKQKSEEAEKNPVKMRRLTRLLFRHWDSWRENVRHHVFVADIAGGRALDLTPRLGAIKKLRSDEFWRAEVRANPGVDFPREIKKAEALTPVEAAKQAAIERAIGSLRPEYRSCIMLRHVEGR